MERIFSNSQHHKKSSANPAIRTMWLFLCFLLLSAFILEDVDASCSYNSCTCCGKKNIPGTSQCPQVNSGYYNFGTSKTVTPLDSYSIGDGCYLKCPDSRPQTHDYQRTSKSACGCHRPGFYITADTYECKKCPEDHYCHEPNDNPYFQPVQCPNENPFSPEGSTGANLADLVAEIGVYLAFGGKLESVAGSSKTSAELVQEYAKKMSYCQKCLPGFKPMPNVVPELRYPPPLNTVLLCIPCDAGTYSDGTSEECTQCPEGQTSDGKGSACYDIGSNPNTGSNPDTNTGSNLLPSRKPTPNPTPKPTPKPTPLTCSLDYYLDPPPGTLAPQPTPTGGNNNGIYFGTTTSKCIQCQNGMQTVQTASIGADSCSCVRPGYYEMQDISCLPCEAGYYCPGPKLASDYTNNACKSQKCKCPEDAPFSTAGSIGYSAGSVTQFVASYTSRGFNYPSGQMQGYCQKCPPGKVPAKPRAGIDYDPATGKVIFGRGPFIGNLVNCKPCEAGTYSTGISFDCIACPKNQTSTAGSSACYVPVPSPKPISVPKPPQVLSFKTSVKLSGITAAQLSEEPIRQNVKTVFARASHIDTLTSTEFCYNAKCITSLDVGSRRLSSNGVVMKFQEDVRVTASIQIPFEEEDGNELHAHATSSFSSYVSSGSFTTTLSGMTNLAITASSPTYSSPQIGPAPSPPTSPSSPTPPQIDYQGAIIGIVVGGVAFILICCVAPIVYYCYRKTSDEEPKKATPDSPGVDLEIPPAKDAPLDTPPAQNSSVWTVLCCLFCLLFCPTSHKKSDEDEPNKATSDTPGDIEISHSSPSVQEGVIVTPADTTAPVEQENNSK